MDEFPYDNISEPENGSDGHRQYRVVIIQLIGLIAKAEAERLTEKAANSNFPPQKDSRA